MKTLDYDIYYIKRDTNRTFKMDTDITVKEYIDNLKEQIEEGDEHNWSKIDYIVHEWKPGHFVKLKIEDVSIVLNMKRMRDEIIRIVFSYYDAEEDEDHYEDQLIFTFDIKNNTVIEYNDTFDSETYIDINNLQNVML